MEVMGVGKRLIDFYAGKKVFLTGHTGFKGSWLLLWLHAMGATVKGYALEPSNDSLYQLIQGDNLCDSVIADIRDAKRLKSEIEIFKPDIVFHLAAQALVKEGYVSPLETFEINLMGTLNLLNVFKAIPEKCNIIVVTTDKVYQNLEKDYAYKEDDKLGGYDPYSASKAATEIAVDSYRNSFFNIDNIAIHKKAIATVRAGNVIGGGDRSKDRLIPDVIHSLEQGSSVNIRNPKSIRPWQHVLDPLYGYLVLGIKLSEDPVNASSAFNLGPDKVDMITVEEVVKKAINIWGEGSYSISSQQKTFHEAGILMLDNSKAKKILEVRPKYRTEKALELTMRWYKEAESRYIQYSLEQIEQFMNEIA